MMQPDLFYKEWNNTINSDHEEDLEKMDLFDMLDDLDNISTNSTEDEDLLAEFYEEPTEKSADIIKPQYLGKDFSYDGSIGIFYVMPNEHSKQVNTDKALVASVKTFCEYYDYTFNDDYEELLRNMHASGDSIEDLLVVLFDIKNDCKLEDYSYNLSFNDIAAIITEYRTFTISELNNIAVAYKEDWFDNTVIKYFALEKRDTGLLLQLMQNNLFNREEALVYTYDLDVFNSYLMLKLHGDFNIEVFNRVNSVSGNLNSYTKGILDNNPLVFLGAHKDYNKIVSLSENTEIDLKLAEKYKANPWLYSILVAATRGYLNTSFIDKYLNTDNKYADKMAVIYENLQFDTDVMTQFDGDFYFSVFAYDITAIDKDKKFIQYFSSEWADYIHQFLQVMFQFVFEENLLRTEYLKIALLMVYKSKPELSKEYLELVKQFGHVSFNQFMMFSLIHHYNINASIPADIGELIMYPSSSGFTYLSIEALIDIPDEFYFSILNKLGDNIVAKFLPDKAGILIENSEPSNLSTEAYKFRQLSEIRSSYSMAITEYSFDKINRYNAYKMMEIAKLNGWNASDNFKQLFNIEQIRYVPFDNILSLITLRYKEFCGLVTCLEAIQCLKIFSMILNHETYAELQIEFIKQYLKLKFGSRIVFENYSKSTLSNISIVEVKNSYAFESVPFTKIISSLDAFVADLNKKNRIICSFSKVSKIIFEGI